MNIEEHSLDLLSMPQPQPIIIMSEESFDYLIKYIDTNCLFILFTITCFSSLICCTYRERYIYKPIREESITPTQISI